MLRPECDNLLLMEPFESSSPSTKLWVHTIRPPTTALKNGGCALLIIYMNNNNPDGFMRTVEDIISMHMYCIYLEFYRSENCINYTSTVCFVYDFTRCREVAAIGSFLHSWYIFVLIQLTRTAKNYILITQMHKRKSTIGSNRCSFEDPLYICIERTSSKWQSLPNNYTDLAPFGFFLLFERSL